MKSLVSRLEPERSHRLIAKGHELKLVHLHMATIITNVTEWCKEITSARLIEQWQQGTVILLTSS